MEVPESVPSRKNAEECRKETLYLFLQSVGIEGDAGEACHVLGTEGHHATVRPYNMNAASAQAFYIKAQGILKGHAGQGKAPVRTAFVQEFGEGILSASAA